jgi:hypothetical protein
LVRCAFFDRKLPSTMPLVLTPATLKLMLYMRVTNDR